jgi:hypothetical protein
VLPSIRLLLPLALGLATAFLVACGNSGGLIPASRADNLSGQLDAVAADEQNGHCAAAKVGAHRLGAEINQLHGLNTKLRRALLAGASDVLNQAATDCQAPPSTAPTTSTQAPTTTSAPPTATTAPSTPSTSTTATPPPTNTGNTNTGTGQTNGGAGNGGNGGAGAGGGGNGKGKGKGKGK